MTDMRGDWEQLKVELASDRSWETLVVAGPTDSGKTTLCRYLGRELAAERRTAAIDCDPGQSVLGPPTTMGLAWEPVGQYPHCEALRFVGSTSPVGHFMQTLTGLARLVGRAAEEGAERVIVDMPGLIDTGAGREFLYQVVDLLEPDRLVALERGSTLEPLFQCFDRRDRPLGFRLPASEAASARSRDARRNYRQQKFRAYFDGALEQVLRLDELGLHGRVPADEEREAYRNRLVALCDRRGFTVALAIIERWEEDELRVYAPSFAREELASIHFGSLALNREGREL